MKSFITAILLTIVLGCNGVVSQSVNYRLPLGSHGRIPIPTQSLLPPSFENPIKDYTVGLLPPLPDGQTVKTVQAPVHQQYTPGLVTRTGVIPQQSSVPARSAVHHHHSTNLVQPNVYQRKTVAYQQLNRQHPQHHHQQNGQRQQLNRFGTIAPVSQQHSHYSASTPQYHAPVRQSAVNSVHYSRPNVQQSIISSRPISSPSARLIQTYPSVSYSAIVPQYGSILNFGNAKLDPELTYIVGDVISRYHS